MFGYLFFDEPLKLPNVTELWNTVLRSIVKILSAGAREKEWYEKSGFNKTAKAFYRSCAGRPKEMGEAKQVLDELMPQFEKSLKDKDVCLSGLILTGSAYEKTTVDTPEFDIMLKLVGGEELKATSIPGHSGYFNLSNEKAHVESLASPGETFDQQIRQGFSEALHGCTNEFQETGSADPLVDRILESYVTTGEQDPNKVRGKFQGDLHKCVNKHQSMNDQISIEPPRQHGTAATQIDFSKYDPIEGKWRHFFSVDVVPAYEVNGNLYVAKPLKDKRSDPEEKPAEGKKSTEDRPAWRLSCSLEEKKMMKHLRILDYKDSGCRMQVLRVLKAIRNRSPELQKLTSHQLKTALMEEANEPGGMCKWKSYRLGARLMDTLGNLEQKLTDGKMPHYFLKDVDLLNFEEKEKETRENMKNRIHNLCTNPNELATFKKTHTQASQ